MPTVRMSGMPHTVATYLRGQIFHVIITVDCWFPPAEPGGILTWHRLWESWRVRHAALAFPQISYLWNLQIRRVLIRIQISDVTSNQWMWFIDFGSFLRTSMFIFLLVDAVLKPTVLLGVQYLYIWDDVKCIWHKISYYLYFKPSIVILIPIPW